MDIELIISDIIDGLTYRTIAKKNNVPLSTFVDFISKSEHSARVKESLELSAQTYEDKGEQVLLDIEAESTNVEMARARELAQYYKWKARVRNPKRYGDKLELEHSGEVKTNNLEQLSTDELIKRSKAVSEIDKKIE